MADDNKDTDVKTSTDPKEDASRAGVVKPRPLPADPPDEDTKTDPGPKTDRAGDVKPGGRG